MLNGLDLFSGIGGLTKEQPKTCDNFRIGDIDWWQAEPSVGRMANGIPASMDRIRGLGNAVVPSQAREAFKRLCGIK